MCASRCRLPLFSQFVCAWFYALYDKPEDVHVHIYAHVCSHVQVPNAHSVHIHETLYTQFFINSACMHTALHVSSSYACIYIHSCIHACTTTDSSSLNHQGYTLSTFILTNTDDYCYTYIKFIYTHAKLRVCRLPSIKLSKPRECYPALPVHPPIGKHAYKPMYMPQT